MNGANGLAQRLEILRLSTDYRARILHDPIVFPKRFSRPEDIEVVAWLSASLAYGRVSLFSAVLERILSRMGARPTEFVRRFDPGGLEEWDGLYYRLNSGRDIACLIYLMRQILLRHGTIGALFRKGYRPEDPDVGPALERFIEAVEAVDVSPVYGRAERPEGLKQLFSRPSKGSACKRLNMFLRWMARPADGLDFGLWDWLAPGKLIIPLDTHVLRIGRYLGLTRRRSGGWRTAQEITGVLRRIDPRDPLKYDFPLCHHGISGNCPVGKQPERCRACCLAPSCAKGRALLRASAGPVSSG